MAKLKQENHTNSSPLDLLQAEFATDMAAVNQTILTHMQSDVPLIPELANYLIASGGKRIRPLLTLAITSLFKGNMNRAHGLSAAVEFIHTATLLHDDVVDDSTKRRGQDSANIVFGNEASVLVGDFLFSRAFQLMVADGSLDTLKTLSDASAIISEGEVLQLTTQNNLNTSIDDYLDVIAGKTASLFAAACEVGAIIADVDDNKRQAAKNYGFYLGMLFQITDDILDYDANRSKLGKTVGDDFREGKMTAPVIYAIEQANQEEKEFWLRTLNDKNQTENDLGQAITLIEKYNSIQKTQDLAKKYCNQAQNSLEIIKRNTVLLKALINFIFNRRR